MVLRRLQPDAVPPRHRRLRWALVVGVGVAVAVTAVLWTGIPQTYIARRVAEKVLGTEVGIQGLSLIGRAHADEVVVRERADDADAPPFVRLKGVAVAYSAFRPSVQSISIDEATIHADGRNPDRTNFGFLRELLARPREDKGPSPYLPRTIRIGKLTVSGQFPAMGLSLDGLRVTGGFDAEGSFTVAAEGEGIKGAWGVETYQLSGAFDDGRVRVEVAQRPDGFSVGPIDIHLPGLAEVKGGAVKMDRDDGEVFELELERCLVSGVDLSHADWPFLPFPVRFAQLDASGTTVHAERTPEGLRVPQAQVNASATALAVGLTGEEWYEGDLSVRGSGDKRRYVAEVVLGQGQRLALTADGTLEEATAAVTLDGWTREQVLGALPKAYRSRLGAFAALSGLSTDLTVEWKRPAYSVKGVATPVLGDEPATVTVDGHGALEGGPVYDGALRVDAGGSKAEVQARVESAQRFAIDAQLDKADLGRWIELVQPAAIPPYLLGTGTGTVAVEAAEDGLRGSARLRLDGLGVRKDTTVEVDGSASAPSMSELRPLSAKGTVAFPDRGGTAPFEFTLSENGGWTATARMKAVDAHGAMSLVSESTWLEGTGSKVSGEVSVAAGESGAKGKVEITASPTPIPQVLAPADAALTVKGSFTADPAFARISGKTLTFASSDDVSAALKDWTLTREGFMLEGKVEGTAPVTRLAPLGGIEDVSGVFTGAGSVKYAEGTVGVKFDVTGEEFGVGRYAAPPGLPITAKGTLVYDTKEGRGRIDELVVRWSDPTEIRFDPMPITAAPAVERTAYTLRTDLAPLVYWGLVEDAEGQATATGTIAYGKNGLALDADYRLEAPTLALSNKLAVLAGVASQGRLRYTTELAGEGRFGAASVAVAGATLRDVVGPFVLENSRLRSSGIRGKLWDGTVSVEEATVDFGNPQLPVTARAAVEKLNLATFTEEYKPPKASLTGIGGGSVSFLWNRDGIADLDVELEASDGLTVNRDLVYQLLLSEYIKNAQTGKRVDRIVNEVVGKEEQRPFDSAAMELEMGGEQRIVGVTYLRSKALRLTIDMKMDPAALTELLRLRQENNLENIAAFRAEPIRLGE